MAEAKTLTAAHPNSREGMEEIVAVPLRAPEGTKRVRFVVRDAGSKKLGSADVEGN